MLNTKTSSKPTFVPKLHITPLDPEDNYIERDYQS